MSNKPNPIRPIGSEVVLTCIVKLAPAVESELTQLIVETELSRERTLHILTLSDPMINGTTYTYTRRLESFGRNNSGDYICTATVKPGPNLTDTQLDSSNLVSNRTKISTG